MVRSLPFLSFSSSPFSLHTDTRPVFQTPAPANIISQPDNPEPPPTQPSQRKTRKASVKRNLAPPARLTGKPV